MLKQGCFQCANTAVWAARNHPNCRITIVIWRLPYGRLSHFSVFRQVLTSQIIEGWGMDYNEARSQSSLGLLTLADFARCGTLSVTHSPTVSTTQTPTLTLKRVL